MADCTQYAEQISSYLDGELSSEETEELFSHVAHCPDCAETLAAWEDLSVRTKESLPAPPSRLANGVVARVRAEKKLPLWRRYRFTIIAALFAAVVLAASSAPFARFFGTTEPDTAERTVIPPKQETRLETNLAPAAEIAAADTATEAIPETPYEQAFAIYLSFSAKEPPETLQALTSDRTEGSTVYYIVSADALSALLNELSTLGIPAQQASGPADAEGYLVILTLI